MESFFKQRVIEVVRGIPKGTVVSYKEVAELAGSPRAFRAVGTVMKNNRDTTVPCHRVVRSDGTLGGYNGNLGKKKELLLREGVVIQ